MRPVLALLLTAAVAFAAPEDEARIRKLFGTLEQGKRSEAEVACRAALRVWPEGALASELAVPLPAGRKSRFSRTLLLAYAANGDVDAATFAFERSLDSGWEPAELYADEDIGPLLKTEKFAALRAQYPTSK